MSRQQNHSHKLRRHQYKSGNKVYFCILPDCNFKVDVALALGKKCICNLCGNEFIMNEYTIKLARPHCESCSKQKVKGLDGKSHFVRRGTTRVLASVAEESSDELRSRLSTATTIVSEKDI